MHASVCNRPISVIRKGYQTNLCFIVQNTTERKQKLQAILNLSKCIFDKKKISSNRIISSSLTQCMPNDKATAFALILEANISGRRRAGTGPAPREKDNT